MESWLDDREVARGRKCVLSIKMSATVTVAEPAKR